MSLQGKASANEVLKGRISRCNEIIINAYHIAVKNGFEGTEEEWLKSLEVNPEAVVEAVNAYLDENPVAVDTTLSQSGAAADAKTTGDEIARVDAEISAVREAVEAIPGEDPAVANHVSDKNNPHGVTAEQVGLGNVDNTSDADKPVSTAQAEAIAEAKQTGTNAMTAAENAAQKAQEASDKVDAISLSSIGAASASHKHSAADVTSGTLTIARGGTGATTAIGAVDALGALNLKNIEDNEHLIANGDNLNDYTTPGAYRCATTAIASSLLNKTPYTSAGFRLLVSSLSTNTSRVQIAIFNAGQSRVYYRHFTSSGSWTPWTRIMTDVLVENSDYGTELPAAGTKGRIFFKKV